MQQDEPGADPAAPEADWRLIAIATLAVFAVYATFTSTGTLPIIGTDENGIIAQAQLLAGGPVTINMGTAPYYHPGYALLLAPVWWLTHDPVLAYKGFMLVSAVVAALLVPVLVSIGEAFGFRRSPLLVLTAAFAALWPSCFHVAHYAWSDAVFRLVFAGHIWVLTRLVSGQRNGWAIPFALSAALLFLVHPRALLILLLAPALLLLLYILRRLDARTFILALGLFAVLTVGEMLLMDYLHRALWNQDAFSAAKHLMGNVLRPGALVSGLIVVLGQFWYQLAASLALAGLGLWFVLRRAIGGEALAQRLMAGYLAAAVLSIALASVGQMLNPVRVDHIAYGRYIDGASIVLLWLGLCWLMSGVNLREQRLVGFAAVGVILAAGVLLASLPMMQDLEPAHPEAVAGIGWISRFHSTPWQFFGANSLLLAAAAGILLLLNRPGQLVVVASFVLASSFVIAVIMSVHSKGQFDSLSAMTKAIQDQGLQSMYWTDEVRDLVGHWPLNLEYAGSALFSDFNGMLPLGAGLLSAEPAVDRLVCVIEVGPGDRNIFLLTNPPHASGC